MRSDLRLTADRLRQVLDYDPETGEFQWKVTLSMRRRAGEVTGSSLSGHGYRRIRIDDELFQAHRLAWLYVHGVWPVDEIDHVNGDRADNRIGNLREANHGQNMQNQHGPRSDNRSGFLGVAPQGCRWGAYIGVAGRTRYLGTFNTPEEASAAYRTAKRELHPFWKD